MIFIKFYGIIKESGRISAALFLLSVGSAVGDILIYNIIPYFLRKVKEANSLRIRYMII